MNTYTSEELLDEFQDACMNHQKNNAQEFLEEIMDHCFIDDAHDALDDYYAEFR